MTNKIPPPPPRCYPSCQRDKHVADRFNKGLAIAATIFGTIGGTIIAAGIVAATK